MSGYYDKHRESTHTRDRMLSILLRMGLTNGGILPEDPWGNHKVVRGIRMQNVNIHSIRKVNMKFKEDTLSYYPGIH